MAAPESPRETVYLTLGINLQELPCLVVGGGRIGSRKALILADAGAKVTVVAPAVSASLAEAVAQGRVQWRQSQFVWTDLDGCTLVVAATSDRELNRSIGREADLRRILSCTTSDAEQSRVLFPAIFDDGEVSIAVHSHGHDCRRSQQVRDELAAWLSRRSEPPCSPDS